MIKQHFYQHALHRLAALSLLCAPFAAVQTTYAYDFEEGGVYYNITSEGDHQCAVTYASDSYNSYSGNVVIPATVTHEGEVYTVTSITDNAFKGCTLNKLTIGPNIGRVGATKFGGNREDPFDATISQLIIAASSTPLEMETTPIDGGYASPFYGNFDYVYIGRNLVAYSPGQGALRHFDTLLSNVEFGSKCTVIDPQLKQSLQSGKITVPSVEHWLSMTGTDDIPEYDLYIGNKKVTSVNFNGFTAIPDNTLRRCTSVTTVTLPATVTSIGANCFNPQNGTLRMLTWNNEDASQLSVSLPNNWPEATLFVPFEGKQSYVESGIAERFKRISAKPWDGLNYSTSGTTARVTRITTYAPTTLVIPPVVEINGAIYDVVEIVASAFQDSPYSSKVTTLVIPGSVTTIGNCAFAQCRGIETIIFEDSEDQLTLSYSNTYENPFANVAPTTLYCGRSIIVPYNFYMNSTFKISNLTIGKRATYISQYLCQSANNVIIEDCDEVLSCSLVGVNKLYLGRNVSGGAFKNTGLTDVTISNHVTKLNCFEGCRWLTNISIPNSVTSIEGAFKDCTGLTGITIPNSVTSIGDNSFNGCTGLTEISIPNSVTSIGDNAFKDCVGLREISMSDAITSIGNYAFSGCTALSEISIPNAVTSIGSYAFYQCPVMGPELFIPNTVTTIGDYAFAECTGIQQLVLQDSDEALDNGVYIINNTPIIHIYLGRNTANASPFRNLTNLETIVIGEKVTSIPEYAFAGCENLEGLGIPSNLTSIGNYAFSGCTSLPAVMIPNTVNTVGNFAFQDCTGLKTATFEDGTENLNAGDRIFTGSGLETVYLGRNLTGDRTFGYSASLTSFTFGSNVTEIIPNMFYYCSNLQDIRIPETVEIIGSKAFYGCSALKEIIIPDQVTSIEDGTFYCQNLETVSLGQSVANISSSAFYGCSKLHKAIIKNPVMFSTWDNVAKGQLIDIFVFNDSYPSTTSKYQSTSFVHYVQDANEIVADNVHYLTDLDGNYLAYKCDAVLPPYVRLLDKTVSVSPFLFEGHNELKRVRLPNSLASLPEGSFKDCTSLKTIVLGTGLKTIDSKAFTGTTLTKCIQMSTTAPSGLPNAPVKITPDDCYNNLSSLFEVDDMAFVPISMSERTCAILDYFGGVEGEFTMPTSVNYEYNGHELQFAVLDLLPGAFAGDDGITKFNFTFDVTTLPREVFSYCSALSNMTIPNGVTAINDRAFKSTTALTQVVIPESVRTIGSGVFYGCSSLSDITINDGVTTLGSSVFRNCTSLTNIELPNTITTIGESPFLGCSSLEHAKLPTGLQSINNSFFLSCSSLQRVEIPRSVKTIGDGVFRGCTALAELTIPNNVTSIGNYVFDRCSALETLVIEDGTTTLNMGYNREEKNSSNLYYKYPLFESTNLKKLYLGRPTTQYYYGYYSTEDKYIKRYSPFYNVNIEELIIGPKLTTIPTRHFEGCHLPNLVIPSNIRTIGDYAFAGNEFAEITIPATVTSIGDRAFRNSYSNATLKKVLIPDGASTLTISKATFDDCPIEEVLIGRNLSYTSGDNSPFGGKTTLKTAWISDMVTTVPGYLFNGCSGLEDLYVGDNVKSINAYAFAGCSNMTKFFVGRAVTSIGSNAFSDCAALTDIYAEPTTPPTVAEAALDPVSKWDCTLHYPENAPYNTAEQWKEFIIWDNNFAIELDKTDVKVTTPGAFILNSLIVYDVPNMAKGREGIMRAPAEQVTWKSTNPDVASVDKKGKVTVHDVTKQVSIGAFLPTGEMANCIINGELGEEIETFDPNTVMLGDINGDGSFNSTDVSMCVSIVLGGQPVGATTEAADLNEDGIYNSTDVSLMVSKVLSGSVPAVRTAPRHKAASTIQPVRLTQAEADGIVIEVSHPDANEYASALIDLFVPKGYQVSEAAISEEIALTHQLAWRNIDERTCRLLVWSMSNADMNTDGTMFSVTLTPNGLGREPMPEVEVKTASFTRIDANIFTDETALGSTMYVDDSWYINGLDRLRVDSSINLVPGGVSIVVDTDTQVVISDALGRYKVVDLKPGDNKIDLAPGVYLINSYKIIVK